MEKLKNNLVAIAVIFFVIAILMPIFILGLYVIPYPDSIDGIMGVDNIGSTADFLAGTMTPFLTIAAFFLLLKGYFMQKEELANTREEMKRSVEALDQQRKIMEEEKIIFQEQREYEMFMRMFEDFRKSFNDISFYVPIISYDGNLQRLSVDCLNNERITLKQFFDVITNIFNDHCNGIFIWKELEIIKLNPVYQDNLKKFAEHIICGEGYNYYAKLFLILDFIDNNISNDHIKDIILKTLLVGIKPSEKFILDTIIVQNIVILEEDDEKFRTLLRKYKKYVGIELIK